MLLFFKGKGRKIYVELTGSQFRKYYLTNKNCTLNNVVVTALYCRIKHIKFNCLKFKKLKKVFFEQTKRVSKKTKILSYEENVKFKFLQFIIFILCLQ